MATWPINKQRWPFPQGLEAAMDDLGHDEMASHPIPRDPDVANAAAATAISSLVKFLITKDQVYVDMARKAVFQL